MRKDNTIKRSNEIIKEQKKYNKRSKKENKNIYKIKISIKNNINKTRKDTIKISIKS